MYISIQKYPDLFWGSYSCDSRMFAELGAWILENAGPLLCARSPAGLYLGPAPHGPHSEPFTTALPCGMRETAPHTRPHGGQQPLPAARQPPRGEPGGDGTGLDGAPQPREAGAGQAPGRGRGREGSAARPRSRPHLRGPRRLLRKCPGCLSNRRRKSRLRAAHWLGAPGRLVLLAEGWPRGAGGGPAGVNWGRLIRAGLVKASPCAGQGCGGWALSLEGQRLVGLKPPRGAVLNSK